MNELERWQQNNDAYLAAALHWLRLKLLSQGDAPTPAPQPSLPARRPSWLGRLRQYGKRRLGLSPSQELVPAAPAQPPVTPGELARARQAMERAEQQDPPPALIQLGQRLGISRFERELLLLCAAMELDPQAARLCARAQGNAQQAYPSFSLALSLFDNPAWESLSPERPLRHWALIEINQPGAQPLTSSALRADERIVNFIKGLNRLDERLTALLTPLQPLEPAAAALSPSQMAAAERICQLLCQARGEGPPLVQLLGVDPLSQQQVAQQVAGDLGLLPYRLPVAQLPAQAAELETLIRLWQRESLLLPLALLLDGHDSDAAMASGQGATGQGAALERFLARAGGVLLLCSRERRPNPGRASESVEVGKPTPQEQRELWAAQLGQGAEQSPGQLAGQFDLNGSAIRELASRALAPGQGELTLAERLWAECVAHSRPQLDQLAQRLPVKAGWGDLVLPEQEERLLRQIAEQVRLRHRVYQEGGFAERMNRGLGISALFAGESGTGKTMAAEVIARELGLDLYRIDLSAVVNKYIGETEKNLRRLFDAAENGGAILFFDEADALFGKRSEVKDSHDRYANIEINYLLQRLEAYRGLAILATNMRQALDEAFVRRLRFIVSFSFPTAEDRQRMWQRVFPPQTHTSGLNLERLARLTLTGANIHNVAMNAAFLAAQADTPVTMPLVLEAARAEYRKLNRPINEAEFRWREPAAASR